MKHEKVKYVFFGVGAVSVVMARALWELGQKMVFPTSLSSL